MKLPFQIFLEIRHLKSIIIFYTVIIFLSDLTYGFVDPRIRYS